MAISPPLLPYSQKVTTYEQASPKVSAMAEPTYTRKELMDAIDAGRNPHGTITSGCRSFVSDLCNDIDEKRAKAKEPVWVSPGDTVHCSSLSEEYFEAEWIVIAKSPDCRTAKPGDYVVIAQVDNDRVYPAHFYKSMLVSALSTPNGRPVAGVRVPEFDEEDMREAMLDICPGAHMSRWPAILDETLAKIRKRKEAKGD